MMRRNDGLACFTERASGFPSDYKILHIFILAFCWLTMPQFLSGGGVLQAQGSNPIVTENQNTGTTSWQLTQPDDDYIHRVKGYASKTSVRNGQSINFYVSVSSPQTYTIDVYRMGWYGGQGGRLMQSIGPLTGITQPTATVDSTTGLVVAPWSVSHTLSVPTSWVSGIYLAKLTNNDGYQNYIKFVVRDDSRNADFLYQHSDTTDQAYNRYPFDDTLGKSLYTGWGVNTITGTPRAVKVSFDRPYDRTGSGLFFYWEYSVIRFLERNGYDVVYSSNLDTHTNGSRLLNYKAFLSAGHDEYYSNEMYNALVGARNAGTNLAFLGANDVYWRTRFEPSASGVPNRVMVVYKNQSLDPEPDMSKKTIRFRDSGQPEQLVLGVQYISLNSNSVSAFQDYIVKNTNHWAFAGTGFAENDVVTRLTGYEVDTRFTGVALPANQSYTLLSESPFLDRYGATVTQNSAIYQAPSGAWIFAAGTMNWGYGLDKSGYVDSRIQQVTHNILNEMKSSSTVGILSQPIQISPLGNISNSSPQFEWQPATNAASYNLAIYNISSDTVIYNNNFSNSNCTAVLCSITISTSIPAGNYTWLVQGVNSSGVSGPWSVYTPAGSGGASAPPGQIAVIAPSGNIATTTAAFSWNEEPVATGYRLMVYDTNSSPSVKVHDQAYTAATICNAGICDITPTNLTLNAGTHRWFVRGYNGTGNGPWGNGEDFSVGSGGASSPPGQITVIAPSGNIATTTPAFSWNEEPVATGYRLMVYDTNSSPSVKVHDQAYTAATICNAGICDITPTNLTLNAGTHRWFVRGYNGTGNGPWGNGEDFTVVTITAAGISVETVQSIYPEFDRSLLPQDESYYPESDRSNSRNCLITPLLRQSCEHKSRRK